jgi:hypothetical protein
VGDGAVLDRHALRPPRRARGVDDVGQVPRPRRVRQVLLALARHGLPPLVEQDGLPALFGQRGEQGPLREDEGRARLGQHEGQPLLRLPGVERDERRAALQDAEQPDHHLDRAFDAEADDRLGPDARAPQVARQLVGARVQFPKAQLLTREDHRGRLRGPFDLRLEQLVETGVMPAAGPGPVPLVEEQVPLLFAQDVQLAGGRVRAGDGALQ